MYMHFLCCIACANCQDLTESMKCQTSVTHFSKVQLMHLVSCVILHKWLPEASKELFRESL